MGQLRPPTASLQLLSPSLACCQCMHVMYMCQTHCVLYHLNVKVVIHFLGVALMLLMYAAISVSIIPSYITGAAYYLVMTDGPARHTVYISHSHRTNRIATGCRNPSLTSVHFAALPTFRSCPSPRRPRVRCRMAATAVGLGFPVMIYGI